MIHQSCVHGQMRGACAKCGEAWGKALRIEIEIKCSNGHVQTVAFGGGVDRSDVERFARILDGTSKMFIHPPGPESSIGKCGICRAPFRATVR